TNGILKKHFNMDFNDKNITIFDPFTGTGSFIARLLSKENGLISDEALKEKFLNNLFAFDIVLLAYYIALINITQAAQNRDGSLKNFKNIALTDLLDGYIARSYKAKSRFGEIFDPLADKILILSAFLGLVYLDRVNAWIPFVILGREFFISGLRVLAANEKKDIPVNALVFFF
uniref:CDP-alcohol phosphatidyltransferase family protein n=1 Tax=Helicobacter pylori TaxID=210 RepID=UPI00240DDC1A